MDAALAFRLIVALTAAGWLLLAGQVFFPALTLAAVGSAALLGAVAVAFYRCGIDTASLLLLADSTAVSLGYLVTLACFPKTPLASRALRRAAARREREEAAERAEER